MSLRPIDTPAADSFDPWSPPTKTPLPAAGPPAGDPDITQPIRRSWLDPRSPSGSGSWTFTDVFVGFGVLLLLSVLLNFVVGIVPGLRGQPALWLTGFLPVWLALLGTCVWACRRHGTGHLIQDLGLKFRPIDLAIGVGAGIGLRLASGIIALIVQAFGVRLHSNITTIVGGSKGVWLVLDLVLAASLIAPLVEEVFFRGLLLSSALSSLQRGRPDRPSRNRGWAITISAALFAALHLSEISDLPTAIVLVGSLLLVGFSNAALVVKTGRLGPAIVTHVVFNGITAIVLLAS